MPFSCAFPDLFSENPLPLSLEPPPLLRMGEKQEKEKNREGRREREKLGLGCHSLSYSFFLQIRLVIIFFPCFPHNSMLPLTVLDGDDVCGVDQVNETWASEIATRKKGETSDQSLWTFVILIVDVRFIFSPLFWSESMLEFTEFDGLVNGVRVLIL